MGVSFLYSNCIVPHPPLSLLYFLNCFNEKMKSINDFPWTIIESPKPSFKTQCMEKMGVLSKEMGSPGYDGPQRVCHARWRHTSKIYILDPVDMGVYLAKSLNDRFHYQVSQSEESIIAEIEKFCKKKKVKLRPSLLGYLLEKTTLMKTS